MPTAVELAKELEADRGALKALFDKHKTDGGYDMPQEVIDEVNRRNDDLTVKAKKWESVRLLEKQARENEEALTDLRRPERPFAFPGGQGGGDGSRPVETKSLGELFVQSDAYRRHVPGTWKTVPVIHDFDTLTLKSWPQGEEGDPAKALLQTTAGWAPFIPRLPRVVLSAQRRPVVADLIPQTETTQSSIKFMEETTFTNAAAPVSEGGTKPESALAFTERTQPVEKLATWLPVTEEQLEDVPQIRATIDNRLRLMLMLTEETQLLTGNGTSPNLLGFLNKTGVQSQAKGADPVPDAIYKGMTLVRWTGFAEPTGVIMHPNDWQDVRLLRTADGLYIWGSPADAGPERIWGLPVIPTTAETENTALLGDFQMYSEIFRRLGIRIDVSDSHSTFFVENKLAIRAEERLALVIYRAAAFCKVTGI